MGVCCIVFDIDGMLFECFMNFLNIEKKILQFLFQNFMFLHVSCHFQHLNKNWCKKKFGGGGGIFFFKFHVFFTFHAISNI